MLDEGVLALLAAVREHGPDIVAYKMLGNISIASAGELLLFNYTDRAVYEGIWNPIERASRGLIVHWPTATLRALPFPKFFNLGERPETQVEALAAGGFEITEKLDGSMGVLYRGPDGPAVATRGSFSSAQARWATAYLRARYDVAALPDDVTLLFEIIYPGNTEGPILRYGATEALFLIGARRFDGYDFAYAELAAIAARFGFPLAPIYTVTSLEELASLAATRTGIEGWVVRFAGGLRVKVKTEDYLRLHRLVVNVTSGRIRDMLLSEPEDIEPFLLRLPDEFQREARAIVAAITGAVDAEEARLRAIFDGPLAALAAEVARTGPAARKPYALEVRAHYRADSAYLFALLDGREIHAALLRVLDLACLPIQVRQVRDDS